MPTTIAGKTVLVTGANRGLGNALVQQALTRGAQHVYAATRHPLPQADRRVTPVPLDVTDPDHVAAAAAGVDSLDVLVNNAGVSGVDDLSDPAVIEAHLAVNLFGTYRVTRAFLPLLTRSRGPVVNVLSLAALASVPATPAYSVSKAAALSLSQSLRVLLADRGVSVQVALPGPIDTDMIRGWDIPKTAPGEVAAAIIDGVENGAEEIFPDQMSSALTQDRADGAVKALERRNAAAVQVLIGRCNHARSH